jgi:hypothetical protein
MFEKLAFSIDRVNIQVSSNTIPHADFGAAASRLT